MRRNVVLLVEGVLIALVGCWGSLAPTLAFWWSHHVIGAGLWAPVQWTLTAAQAVSLPMLVSGAIVACAALPLLLLPPDPSPEGAR